MAMCKTQIICCIIVFFIGVFYFVSAREKTKSHVWYSTLIILSLFQLVFDTLSVITVNNLETIPQWINRLVHQAFMTLMLAIFFVVYKYIETVIEDEIGERFQSAKWAYAPLLVSFLGVLFLPIYYKETPQGNYSYGPGPINIYISIALYVILILRLLFKYGRLITRKKSNAILVAMISEAVIASYQAIVPTALISCLGITLLNLSFYLMVENPDAVLVELLRKETKRADDANRAKTDFLASMSHEIRTPINSMVGMTEMILRENSIDRVKEYARDVQNATKSLLSIINDILDITRIEAGKMVTNSVEYSFGNMIKEVIAMMVFRTNNKEIEFKTDIDKRIPDKLLGDDIHIKQVLINLLSNAFKYTTEGSVLLKIELMPESNEKEAFIYFLVKDTGIGIKKEDMDRILIPYERFDVSKNRNIEGIGLGMPITFKLLADMGSKMHVESEYGKGSEFSFILRQNIIENTPIEYLKEKSEQRQEDTAYVPMFQAPNARVLVVDDNQMNRKVFRALLNKTKIQVDEASGGRECIQMVQETAYDIIFMDHMMPEMDGIETYNILKEMEDYPNKKTPVVVVTANAILGAKDRYIIKEGFRAYISKPIEYQKLEKLIKALLKKDLIQAVESESILEEKEEELPIINGLDWGYAESHFPSRKNMLETLEFFRLSIGHDAEELQSLYENLEDEDGFKNYCTKIHSMKNSAATVGIIPLAGMAKVMEDAARGEQRDTIDALMPVFMAKWNSYKELLSVVVKEEEKGQEVNEEQWRQMLVRIRQAAEDMDITSLDRLAEDMKTYTVPTQYEEQYQNIQDAILRFDVEYLMKL